MASENYQHLLLAVDFEKSSEPVVARAARLRDLSGARLTLLHVVEHIPPAMESMYLGYSGEMALPAETLELEEELMEAAQREMQALGDQLGVPAEDRILRAGATAHVIDEVAAELGVDLVVVGTHGSQGLLGIFGSTARTVMKGANCDVLCVRISDPDAQ
ncbi:universal stress protein [Thiorhodococcus mannitoliphagus]|uniref:Universal stress protein n=1 Tax=Thiorhodococcus mannitoliphagus TaxID=329406 RepID=A0A6P1DWS9_9GAMM|nr:universal stress protein [Thiorhodococcus mannitoliphagus]NEX22767.1 universal stress protein [Thiorhodococcus mannitoliphagus]